MKTKIVFTAAFLNFLSAAMMLTASYIGASVLILGPVEYNSLEYHYCADCSLACDSRTSI